MATTVRNAPVTTKLIPPTRRDGLVERSALLSRIEHALDHRLVLVCAPAGYGKTSLIQQAYRQLVESQRHAGWISLDESDKDLSHFISCFLEAARRGGLRFGQSLATVLGAGANLPNETLKTLILNELASLESDLFVFLDDYHLVADPEIRALVNALLLSPLRNVHLIIATRTFNQLPLSRLRALDRVYEVEAADLMFSEIEIAEFVEKMRGHPLSPVQLSRLREGTEGWAASLQLATIAMRGITDVDQFLDRFSGEHKSICDFLGDEVLRGQPTELQEFLTATSILKRFKAGLCDAVTGRTDGRAMLDEVEQRNLFVFSLDSEHHWYRYHHLFADFLRRRLAERHPEQVTEYHQRACEWFAENRYLTSAIDHAFHANDIVRAGELLDAASADLFAAGQTATLLSLSSKLPPELRDRLPRLQLECAWQDVLRWNFEKAMQALDRVQSVLDERGQSGGAAPEEISCLSAKLAHRRCMLALLSDDTRVANQGIREWNQSAPTRDVFMVASAGSLLMATDRELYCCEGTATASRMLQERFVESGASYGTVFHQCIAGATFMMRGELQLAQEAYDHSLEVAVELHGEQSPLYTMPALMLAELHYERNHLQQAEEMLAQREVNSELGFVDNIIAGFITRSRLAMLRGRLAEASNLLEEGGWVANRYRFRRLYAHLLNEQVRQAAAQGHAKEVGRVLREARYPTLLPDHHASAPSQGSTTADEILAVVSCRIWLEQDSAREAAALLKGWYAFTKARHCYRSALRTGTLLAKAYARLGDRRAAQRVLVECLQFAEPGGFIRSFVDEGPELLELLDEISRTQVADGATAFQYISAILAAAESPDRRARFIVDSGSAAATCNETLSHREARILELGSRGMQNQDIAEAMCLAESTVKWYWQRVFDKLEVRRRPDAIKKARLLQLIP